MERNKIAAKLIKGILKDSPDTHNIYTPLELCDKMIAKLPVLNTDMIILVMFNLEFIWVIKEKIKDLKNVWFLTPDELKKKAAIGIGINENQVILYEYNKKEDIKMKFDVVIGNPPYNSPKTGNNKSRSKLLYPRFVELSYRISKQYCMLLIPFRWSKIESLKEFRQKMFHKYNISYIEILNNEQTKEFENIALASGMCFYISNKHNNTSIINVKDSNSIIKFDVNKNEIYINNSIIYEIIDKIQLKSNDNMRNHYNRPQWIKSNDKRLLSQKNDDDDIPVMKAKNKLAYINRSFLKNKLENYKLESYKLILPLVYGVWKQFGFCESSMFILEKGIATTESLIFFSFSSKLEAENCKKYILSKFAIALNHIVQVDRTFSPSSFIYMPYMDFSQEWTDEKLYKYFELTKEQIEFIEKNISKHY